MSLFSWLPCCGPRQKGGDDDTSSAPETAPLIAPPRDPSIISDTYGATDTLPGQGQETLSTEQRRRIETIGREAGSQMLSIHRSPRHPTSRPSSKRHTSNPHPTSSSSAHPAQPSRASGPGLPKTDTMDTTTSTLDRDRYAGASGSNSVVSSRASSPSPVRSRSGRLGSSRGANASGDAEPGAAEDEEEQQRGRGRSGAVAEEAVDADMDADGPGEVRDTVVAKSDLADEGAEGEKEGEVVTKQVFMGSIGGGGTRGKGRGRGRGRGKWRGK